MDKKKLLVIALITALFGVGLFYFVTKDPGEGPRSDEYSVQPEDQNPESDQNSQDNTAQNDQSKKDVPGSTVVDEGILLIYTSYGHSADGPISEEEALTTCQTSSNTDCTFYLVDENGKKESLGTVKSNSKGIATWNWTNADTSLSGKVSAFVASNYQESDKEELYIK